MRKTAGIMLILVGATGFAIYGIVMLRLPIPGVLLSRLGDVVLYVDPVGAPISAGAFLIGGILLLRRRSKPTLIVKILMRLIAAVALWAALIAVCFIYPSSLGYAGLGLLYLWYVHIPLLFAVVCIVWPVMQWVRQKLGPSAIRLLT